jgi:hypothetical protein
MWPWQAFDWGVFWAVIAAFVVADLWKSLVQVVLEKLNGK